ncbi:MAG: hypothetical protein AAF432_08070 [Planctomycetota bacterium]
MFGIDQRERYRGLSRLEAIVLILIVVFISAMVWTSRFQSDHARAQRTLKDKVWLSQIHKLMVLHAQNNNDRLPTPGLIDRLPDPNVNDQNLAGERLHDPDQNSTANVFSAMIAQEYFQPDLVISPVECNSRVVEKSDYNFDAYQPAEDQFWDDTFAARLEVESNTSYVTMPLVRDELRDQRWRANAPADVVLLGNRGPRPGAGAADSVTFGFHRPDDAWSGHVVFGTGEVRLVEDTAINGDELFEPDGNHLAMIWKIFNGTAFESWDE